MRIIPIRILTFLTLFFTGLYSYSAPGNPPPPQQIEGAPPPPPPGFSIDTGLLFLFFVAVIYGFYRVYEFNKSENKLVE